MRWVYFGALLWMALTLLSLPRRSKVAPAITVNPDSPWVYQIDGLELYGWRTFDWSALVAGPRPEPPVS